MFGINPIVIDQAVSLLKFLFGGVQAAKQTIADAKNRGYEGDTTALLAAAVEADKIKAEAHERAK